MEIKEILQNSIITGIEFHTVLCLLVVMLYINMRNSYIRNSRKPESSLTWVYICIALTLVSDCAWSTISMLGVTDTFICYIVNLAYFFGSASAAVCWFMFSTGHFDEKFKNNNKVRLLGMLPFAAVMVLYIISPWTHLIFSIQNGEYIRGSLFYLDPLIKLGYIGHSAVYAIVKGSKKEIQYLRKQDYKYALFGLPVIICGVFQSVTGVDFNCPGITFGLILIYITGLTNKDSENTEALYSLGNSFDASYIVNLDSGQMRPLHRDTMHSQNIPEMQSMEYAYHFNGILSQILVPEDKITILQEFDLKNVDKRFKIDNSFTLRYRVKDENGLTNIHTASFIKVMSNDGRRDFLLGINAINFDSLLYERNETLRNENLKLEKINSNIIESVAKIVDARDNESGGHIVRVKKLSEIIGRGLMELYPELNLDEESIKLISSASVLHDVGKIVTPDAVLLKPGRLTPEEFEIMKTHTTKGCDILNMFPLGMDDAFLECALSICRWHHEKYDGKGYPDGLVGDAIPLSAQIVSVADCYDALVSERPYKPAYSPEIAIEMILQGQCGQFNPKLMEAMKKRENKLAELSRLYR